MLRFFFLIFLFHSFIFGFLLKLTLHTTKRNIQNSNIKRKHTSIHIVFWIFNSLHYYNEQMTEKWTKKKKTAEAATRKERKKKHNNNNIQHFSFSHWLLPWPLIIEAFVFFFLSVLHPKHYGYDCYYFWFDRVYYIFGNSISAHFIVFSSFCSFIFSRFELKLYFGFCVFFLFSLSYTLLLCAKKLMIRCATNEQTNHLIF